jgi:hypothetical protein
MALVGAATAGEAADAFAAAEGSGDASAAREALMSEACGGRGTPVAKSMPIAPKLKLNTIQKEEYAQPCA